MNTIKLNTTGERPIKKVAGSGVGGMKYYRYDGDQGARYDFFNYWASMCTSLKIQWHERSEDSGIDEKISGKVSIWYLLGLVNTQWSQFDLRAIAVDVNARYYNERDDVLWTIKEYIPSMLSNFSFTEITEEEFYSL